MTQISYEVSTLNKPVNYEIQVPGSKSITNRALLLAALAKGQSHLSGVLFSDDSRHFMKCLQELGYVVDSNEQEKTVDIEGQNGGIPKRSASVYVGSAGTAARFITAMLALPDGEYVINASEQMKARPMQPLFDALLSLGVKVDYLEKTGFLPCKLRGGNLEGGAVALDAGCSSQFISALLMTAGFYKKGLEINLQGKETSKSYVQITTAMMKQFGCNVDTTAQGFYLVAPGQRYTAQKYKIEPDVSSASYFFAMATLTGGTVLVKDVYYSSIQGDIKFLNVLKQLGSTIEETDKGLWIKGPASGLYPGIEVDMNDFSDQTMTLAALAPFASSPTVINNIHHIRYQESDRIRAIVTELTRMGIKCNEREDGITIYPGHIQPATIETYDDHRMAMAFSLIGLRAKGIKIANPACTSKTYENYFSVLDEIINKA